MGVRSKDVLSICQPVGINNQTTDPFTFFDGDSQENLEDIALTLGNVPGDRFDYLNQLKPGVHPGFNQDLLWSDDAELLGAGYHLIDGLKGRNEITFAPIVDPEGVHAEVYADRLARFNKVYDWRHEFEAMKSVDASLSRGDWAHLRWRRDLEPAKVLEVMKRDGKL